MQLLWWSLSATCLLPTASAFYPYHFTADRSQQRRDYIRARRPSVDSDGPSLRLPIRRVQTKRDNNYNVIPAEDPSAPNSAGVDQDGTDFSYFSAFTFGTGSQEYYLLIDTGASNTWIMGSECAADACSLHNTLGPSDSDSLDVTDKTFDIAYGTGQVAGRVATDTVHFAGMSAPLTFGLGNNVSDEFASYPMDGIVGLGRGDSIEPAIDGPTFLDSLFDAGIAESKLFGLNLWRASDGGANDGEISFGAPNSDMFSGDLAYTDTVKNADGFWEIPVDDASVDGESIAFDGKRTALLDSGTSFILMPPDDAQKLHALIDGSVQNGETYTVPCGWKGTVSLKINKVDYDISYKDVVQKGASGGQCNSNIIGRQTFGETQWLVGDVFLKNVYSVFDLDHGRVGFGDKAGDAPSSSQSGASTSSSRASSAAASKTASPDATSTKGMQSPCLFPLPIMAERHGPSGAPAAETVAASAGPPLFNNTTKHVSLSNANNSTIASSRPLKTPESTPMPESHSSSAAPETTSESAAHSTTIGTYNSPRPAGFSDSSPGSLDVAAASPRQHPKKLTLVSRILSSLFVSFSATAQSKPIPRRGLFSSFFVAAQELDDLWRRDLPDGYGSRPEGKIDHSDFEDWDYDDWIPRDYGGPDDSAGEEAGLSGSPGSTASDTASSAAGDMTSSISGPVSNAASTTPASDSASTSSSSTASPAPDDVSAEAADDEDDDLECGEDEEAVYEDELDGTDTDTETPTSPAAPAPAGSSSSATDVSPVAASTAMPGTDMPGYSANLSPHPEDAADSASSESPVPTSGHFATDTPAAAADAAGSDDADAAASQTDSQGSYTGAAAPPGRVDASFGLAALVAAAAVVVA